MASCQLHGPSKSTSSSSRHSWERCRVRMATV
jgi:hypothetical protein